MAADETPTPPGAELDCDGPDLSNLPNTIKALAAAARLIKAGRIPTERAGSYVNALTSLVKAYQDQRDSKWLPRVKEMWREREAAKERQAVVQ